MPFEGLDVYVTVYVMELVFHSLFFIFFCIYFMLKSYFECHVLGWGRVGEFRIPPPPGRVNDGGSAGRGGSSELAVVV